MPIRRDAPNRSENIGQLACSVSNKWRWELRTTKPGTKRYYHLGSHDLCIAAVGMKRTFTITMHTIGGVTLCNTLHRELLCQKHTQTPSKLHFPTFCTFSRTSFFIALNLQEHHPTLSQTKANKNCRVRKWEQMLYCVKVIKI